MQKHFTQIGATLEIEKKEMRNTDGYRIDIKGDTYLLDYDPSADITFQIIQVLPEERHLLLMARHPESRENEKYLCGHDEREFFVSRVPSTCVDVRTAIEALKPRQVRDGKLSFKRKTDKYVRQGEWFFIPVDTTRWSFGMTLKKIEEVILKNEEIRMGRAKPHIVEELARIGGRTVFICNEYPDGVSEAVKRRIDKENPDKKFMWVARRANATVFARGSVRHPDHKTIHLQGWHMVVPNNEVRTSGRHGAVLFID